MTSTRRPTRTLLAALLAAAAVTGVSVGPVAAAAPTPSPVPPAAPKGLVGASGLPMPKVATAPAAPRTPSRLPVALEGLGGYVQQRACDPRDRVGTVALGRLLTGTYKGTSFGVSRSCAQNGLASEHYEGRALDWMVNGRDPARAAQAVTALNWMFAPDAAGNRYAVARRLGVMYLIWNDRIWGAYAPEAGWRPYSSCAKHPEPAWDTACHRDHVHISLTWEGAMGRTSFWTRRVAVQDFGPCRPADLNWAPPYVRPQSTPCPRFPSVTPPPGATPLGATLVRYSGAHLRAGLDGPVVTSVQRALGLRADGSFGGGTAAAVSAFRSRTGLTPRGVVDAATWRALLRTSVLPPARPAPGTPTTPAPRPAPKPLPPAPPKAKPAPAPKPVLRHPELQQWRGTVLRAGATGPAVSALQRRLGVRVTGYFGPLTRTAVVTFQRRGLLPKTGVVGPLTWAALITR